MTRNILAVLFVLLTIPYTAAAAGQHGNGCWRTAKARQQAAVRLLARQRTDHTDRRSYIGHKKGLVILADFQDAMFQSSHDQSKYYQILNTPGYTTDEGFVGSVADYFRDQSGGQFELTFYVVGPYTAKYGYRHYGENDEKGLDVHPEELIVEMCLAADDEVDFHDYDWDGDGEVDEVFVVYAGKGESDSGNSYTIWPHMWTLEEAGSPLALDGVNINVYACANEITKFGQINGIGIFCHEFSHCLGLPDVYDTWGTGQIGMGSFDIMAHGNMRGNGFMPVGFTAYEKMVCGWQEPIVLGSEDVTVDGLAPMSEHGDSYIIYNSGYADEYYMIENRQRTGWDAMYPATGMLITHIDYDYEVWLNNIPNAIITEEKAAEEEDLTCTNDHPRMTMFFADNNRFYGSGSLYPYWGNDSLTATSKPAATLYHANARGTLLMEGAILNIRQNSDNTVSFNYRAAPPLPDGLLQSHADSPASAGCIYNLAGLRVAETTPATLPSSLPKGIYIVNGKKVVR